MNEFDLFKAILLGTIQGITEFLPISSSAHLALTQRWLGLDPNGSQMLLFDVMVHLGTLVAVGIVFAKPARCFVYRLMYEWGPHHPPRRYTGNIVLLTVAATIPTGIIGLTFKSTFEAAFDEPFWIGICLIVTGVLLAGLAKLPRGRRGWRTLRWWEAVLVGVGQSIAILPGISRSGATICIASYCGWRRRWAVEFSFLIAVPAIAGATLLKIKEAFELSSEQFAGLNWTPLLVGSAVSLVVGVLALRLLLNIVRRAKLHYFAAYCWAVGGLIVWGSGG